MAATQIEALIARHSVLSKEVLEVEKKYKDAKKELSKLETDIFSQINAQIANDFPNLEFSKPNKDNAISTTLIAGGRKCILQIGIGAKELGCQLLLSREELKSKNPDKPFELNRFAPSFIEKYKDIMEYEDGVSMWKEFKREEFLSAYNCFRKTLERMLSDDNPR